MVYGIISAKDNQTSLAYFKSKKVSQGNMVTADRLQQVANVLSAGAFGGLAPMVAHVGLRWLLRSLVLTTSTMA